MRASSAVCGRGMFERCDNKKRRPRQEAEDLILTIQKEKRKANILRTVFLAQGALWLPNEASRMRRTRTDREDLFRDQSYFKHPRRARQAFCEDRVCFGVGGVFAAGEPLKRQKKKNGSNWHEALVANYRERRTVYQQTLFEISIYGYRRIVNKRKPRLLSADAG